MKRFLIGLGVTLAVIAVVIGGAYWWISRPVELQAFDEPGPSMEVKQQNSLVQTLLLNEGIESSLVDITAQRAFVAYDAPAAAEGSEPVDADELQENVLFWLATAVPDANSAVIVMYVDKEPTLKWTADLDAYRALPEGDDGTAFEAYLAGIERAEL